MACMAQEWDLQDASKHKWGGLVRRAHLLKSLLDGRHRGRGRVLATHGDSGVCRHHCHHSSLVCVAVGGHATAHPRRAVLLQQAERDGDAKVDKEAH